MTTLSRFRCWVKVQVGPRCWYVIMLLDFYTRSRCSLHVITNHSDTFYSKLDCMLFCNTVTWFAITFHDRRLLRENEPSSWLRLDYAIHKKQRFYQYDMHPNNYHHYHNVHRFNLIPITQKVNTLITKYN